jgi:CubicO group peptidase (beta-lactamase class C family)
MLMRLAMLSALAVLVTIPPTVHARQQSTRAASDLDASDIARRVRTTVARFTTETKVPGLAFGIIADGQVILMEAVGSTAPADACGRPSDPGTVFHLASLSKPFVATAIVALTEQQKVALDDPVVKHLPYFRLADDRFSQITIRQLLMHVSGLPDVEDYGWATPEYDEGALERYVKSLASVKLRAAPRDKYAYSNIGYDILGDVIAKSSGRTFEAFVADTIFRPLGMSSSTLLLAEVPRERLATPCVRAQAGVFVRAKHFPYNRAHAPSSTLYSTVTDMLRWLQANLSGELESRRIVSAQGFRTMFSDGVERSKAPIRSIQNMGWSTLILDGVSVHGHGGHDSGFRAMMVFAPTPRAGVVIMTNGDAENVKVDSLGLELLGIVLGKNWSQF